MDLFKLGMMEITILQELGGSEAFKAICKGLDRDLKLKEELLNGIIKDFELEREE